MANMSYCRFENTYNDLLDCSIHINSDLSERESRYRKLLIELCNQIIEDFEFNNLGELEDDDLDVWDEQVWLLNKQLLYLNKQEIIK